VAQVENAVRVQSEVASLGLYEARVSLDDMRVNLADFRPGLGDNMVPNASEMLKRQAESVRASIYRPPSLLRENVVNGLIKPPIPPPISPRYSTPDRGYKVCSARCQRWR
jgi:hypothetical protein